MVDKIIRIGIDSGPAEAGAKRVESSLNRIKAAAAAAIGKGVPVKIDTSDVGKASAEVRKLSDVLRAAAAGSKNIDLNANASGLTSEIKKAEAAIESLKKQTESLSKNSPLRLNSAGFVSEAERVIASLKDISSETENTKTSAVALGTTLRTTFVAAAAAVGAAELMRTLATSVYAANVEYQKLMASLETVTGSAKAAKIAFAEIQKFAESTPYSLSQVTEAFIKLKALGLDSSQDSMRSFGNTASAMGKSLNDMIEAVADASTGEMERLKEFGITAKKEGDKVTFTFQGIATTIGNNASEIQKYLRDIGNVQFAGGMARQADTLGGKFAALTDKANALFVKIGEAGLSKGLMNVFDAMGRVLTQAGLLGEKFGWLGGVIANDLAQFLDDVNKNLQAFNNLAGAISGGNTATSVTVPVIDNVAGGMKPEQLSNLTATTDKPSPDQPLPKQFQDTFGGVMSLREASQAPTPFLISQDDKPIIRSNVLRFGRPSEDEADSDASKAKSSGRGGGGGGGGRNIAAEFGKEVSANKEMIRTLALIDQSYERGRGAVEGFRNSMEELNVRMSAQQQFGEKNAEVLVDQAMAMRAYQEQIAFKGEVLNQREAIDQTVSLAEAYKQGTVAVMEAEAGQKAWNTAVGLGVSSSPELVQQLKDLSLEAEAAGRYLALETDLAGMDQQIESAARLATAYRQGGAAIRDATLEEQVRAAAVAAGLEWDEASVDKIRQRMTALRDLAEVQKSDQKTIMANIDMEVAAAEIRNLQLVGEEYLIASERLNMLADKKRETQDEAATLTAEEERLAVAMGQLAYQAQIANDALSRLANDGRNTEMVFRDAVAGGLGHFEDALVGIVTGAKSAREAFADMARSIAADLARMAIRMAIIQPLAAMFGGGFGGAVAAPVFGGFASSAAVGPITWGVAHSGGIIGSDGIGQRTLPRFHNGGLAANEVPAILEKGEGVFTKDQMRALQPANGNVGGLTVVNNINVQAPPGGDRAAAENQANLIARHVEMAVDERLTKATRNGGILNPNGGY